MAKAGGNFTPSFGAPPRRFPLTELREQERQQRQQRRLLQQMLECSSLAKRRPPPVRKLLGKEWIRVGFDRRRAAVARHDNYRSGKTALRRNPKMRARLRQAVIGWVLHKRVAHARRLEKEAAKINQAAP